MKTSERLDRIEAKIDVILEKQSGIQERQASIETTQRGFAAVLMAIITAGVGYVFNLFNK